MASRQLQNQEPVTELHPAYSSSGASATAWPKAREHLEQAEIFWLTTVRPDGRPHVTPLLAIWLDGALHFCTGTGERKAKNLAHNPQVVLTTGCNDLHAGLDIVVEGEAVRVRDEVLLQRLADAWETKYAGWHFDVRDGAFWNEEGGEAYVFQVAPQTAFGFGRGEQYSQTRWRFV
jgi:general stress protein 26